MDFRNWRVLEAHIEKIKNGDFLTLYLSYDSFEFCGIDKWKMQSKSLEQTE